MNMSYCIQYKGGRAIRSHTIDGLRNTISRRRHRLFRNSPDGSLR